MESKSLLLPAWRLQLMALAARCKAGSLESANVAEVLAPILKHALPGLLLEVGPCLLPALTAHPEPTPMLAAVIKKLRGWRVHPMRSQTTLSAKEYQVLGLLATGQSNKTIALELDVSENTVKFHLKHLFAKLGVDNRTAALNAALRQGHLAPPF